MSIPTDITALEAALIAWAVAASGYAEDAVRWAQQPSPRPGGAYIELNAQALLPLGTDWIETRDNPLVFADKPVSAVSTSLDQLTVTAHAITTGTGPVRVTSSGTVPGGLTAGVDYWAVAVGANALSLATTHALAVAASPTIVDITSAGTGSIAIVDTVDTRTQGAEIQRATRGVRELVLGVQVFAGPAGRGFGVSAPLWTLNTLIASLAQDVYRDALYTAGLGFQQAETMTALQGGLGQGILEPRAATRLRFGVTSELIGTATYIEFVEITDTTRSVTYEIG